jgi:predicted dehydrogenase
MNKLIKVAIVGTGHIAEKFHLPAWQKNKKIKIVAICDINQKKLDLVANKFKVKSKYTELKIMVKNEDIDILNICTPPYLHYEQIKLAIKNNINVLVEKPFIVSKKKFLLIKKNSIKKKLTCTCALHQRFRPISRKIKKLIDRKLIGDIYYINILKRQFRGIPRHSKFFSEKKFSGGGPLIDLGSHYLDLVFWFLKFPKIDSYSNFNFNNITRMNTNKKYLPFKKFNAEELSVGQIFCKNNTLVNYELGYALNQKENITSIEIFGTKGSIRWPSGELTLTKNNKNYISKIKIKEKKASFLQVNDFIENYKKRNKTCVNLNEVGYIVELIDNLYAK